MEEGHRVAIYWAPARGTPLARFGAGVLGRDAATGAAMPQPAIPGLEPETVTALTAAPRRYGFHATLKAPFRLAPGSDPAALHAAVARFAAAREPVAAPPLVLEALGRFLALVPAAPAPALDALAAACVEHFDRFRAPPTPEEIARHRPDTLSPRERRHLERWGYPYVFDDFRFHLTLAGPMDEAEQATMAAALAPRAARFRETPLLIDALSVFEQPAPDRPFIITARYPFATS